MNKLYLAKREHAENGEYMSFTVIAESAKEARELIRDEIGDGYLGGYADEFAIREVDMEKKGTLIGELLDY